MREILFRGKRVDNGEWVEGYFIKSAGMPFISAFAIKQPVLVIPETVGQYTGLTDKNDTKIYILRYAGTNETLYNVGFENGSYVVYCFKPKRTSFLGKYAADLGVIGNIYDKESEK